MARGFDAAGETLANENGLSGIDVDVCTYVMWMFVDTEPGGERTAICTGSAYASGQSAAGIYSYVPTTSGWQLRFTYRFTTTIGWWEYNVDLNLNQWYHCAVVYDRSSVDNNPVMYIDGASVAVTEDQAPDGTPKTGVDTIVFGENVGGSQAYEGYVAEVAIWGQALTANQIKLLAAGVSPIRVGVQPADYWPMVGASPEPDYSGNADNLTVGGAPAVVAHAPVAPMFAFGGAVSVALASTAPSTQKAVGITDITITFST